MKLSNVDTTLNKFGKVVTTQAKKNIVDRRINSGGVLRRSISHKRSKKGLDFYMEDYGVLRDAGQLGKKRKILKGWNKSIFIPRGKGFTTKFPNITAIKKWIRTKPIRGNNSLNSMAFLIARKIYNEGIQPGLFFSDAFNDNYKRLEKDILIALERDIDNLID